MSENTEELKSQLENPNEEEEEEKKEEEEKEESEEEKNEEEGGTEEGGEEFQMPDKFKGKSAEEIARSYTELEKMIEKKAKEKAEEILKEREGEEFAEPKEGEEEEEFEETPPTTEEKIDFASMTPEEFAKWILKEVEKRAEEKARKIYEDSSKIRAAVRDEIREAQKSHPLLKTSSEYRELVLAIIESAASKGKTIKLKDACAKVDSLIGGGKKEPDKEEKEKLKKARAQVEIGTGAAPAGGELTEEERIKEGMLAGGNTGELGGLGI